MTPITADRAAVIATIETIPLRIPLKAGSTPGASLWGDPLSAADSLLVKVTTDDGVEGWGKPSVSKPSIRPNLLSINSSHRCASAGTPRESAR